MLIDAISDLANEARTTGQEPEALVAEIAADYGLNPALVIRKFHEMYPNGLASREEQARAAELQAQADAQAVARNELEAVAIAEFFQMNPDYRRTVPKAADRIIRQCERIAAQR